MFRTERGTGPGYFVTVIVCQIVFGILASMIVAWFSRWREFRADAGSARLLGPQPMVNALRRLGGLAARPVAAGAAGVRHLGRRRPDGAVRIASADRGTHRGVAKAFPRPAERTTTMRYKIEVQDDTGIWTDVRGSDGALLVYDDEGAARAALAERFPVLVQMEKYAGGKRTRVIRIIEDEEKW